MNTVQSGLKKTTKQTNTQTKKKLNKKNLRGQISKGKIAGNPSK